jgi:hypothetical protein
MFGCQKFDDFELIFALKRESTKKYIKENHAKSPYFTLVIRIKLLPNQKKVLPWRAQGTNSFHFLKPGFELVLFVCFFKNRRVLHFFLLIKCFPTANCYEGTLSDEPLARTLEFEKLSIFLNLNSNLFDARRQTRINYPLHNIQKPRNMLENCQKPPTVKQLYHFQYLRLHKAHFLVLTCTWIVL